MAEQRAEAGVGGKQPVRLGEKFEIYPDRPLDELRSPNAAAFVAVDRERPSGNLFALVCDPDLPARHDMMTGLRGLRVDAMLAPHEWGVVDWPLAGRRSLAIVFDRPAGGRVVPSPTQAVEPMHPDDLIHNMLPPLIASMREFFSAALTHRSIRANNLFYRDAAHKALVFGECVSAPPASQQPIAYETIESAMATPVGRGNGTAADDLYALGVTIIFLLLGRIPGAAHTDEQLLLEKINRGSYYALLAGERVPGVTVELLRGLLTDDPQERWTVQDIEMWLEGRRMSPRQPAQIKRAARPFELAGRPFFTARSLAHAFSRDQAGAARALKGQDFEIWMLRSLCDDERSKALGIALSEGNSISSGAHDERLVARVCIALDPLAPIRYKTFSAAIDGFGTALVAAFRGRGSIQAIAEAMGGRLPLFWFSAQAALKPEHAPILKSFERLRLLLDDRRPGFGMERVLYEMNPQLHCLSPVVEPDYILDAGDMLPALERSSQRRTGDDFQIDRHMAAFLAVRFRGGGNDWHDSLASQDPAERVLGTLYLLSRLQSSRGPASVPAIAQRLARHFPAVIDRFHNRSRRARFRAEIPKLVSKGDLEELLSALDNSAERQRDTQGFSAAQRELASIDRDLNILRIEVPRRPERALEFGARYAATASGVIAWLIALIVIATTS